MATALIQPATDSASLSGAAPIRAALIAGAAAGVLLSCAIVAPTAALAKPAHYKVTNIQNKQKDYLFPLYIDANGLVTGDVYTTNQDQILGTFQSEKGYFDEVTSCGSADDDIVITTAVDSLDDEVGACGSNNFIRLASNGVFTPFLVNGTQGTITGITAGADILTGTYYVYNGTTEQAHGFLGQIGHFLTIDPPGSVNTYPTAISPGGKVTGMFYNAANVIQAFTLIDGVYNIFSPAGWFEPYPAAINDAGQVAGAFSLGPDQVSYGFAYQAGSAPIILAPAGTNGVGLYGINSVGQITGYNVDSNLVSHGVMWAPWTGSGNLFTFEGPAGSQFITGYAINDNAQIAGLYLNAKSVWTLFSATCVGITCQ